MGVPTVHPQGVTIYKPEKCYNGFTLFQAAGHGIMLINMNGKPVRLWRNMMGFPTKMLPGGQILAHTGQRDNSVTYQDDIDVCQVDWDGNIVWKFDHNEFAENDPDSEPRWVLRQHHDFQREGNPVGYYVPGMDPKTENAKNLFLVHKNCYNKNISPIMLEDDNVIETDAEGNIIWRWEMQKHFNELGLDAMTKLVIYKSPSIKHTQPVPMGDWAHINCVSVLGPNKWYDAGDERFHPDNLIMDSRQLNIIFIVSKKTGKIVWKLGPDFTASRELRMIGPIIGPHHSHIIPKGLPGEGNLLVYDNGGWAGMGAPHQTAPDGNFFYTRDHSRVLEIDPMTLKIVWQLTPGELGCGEIGRNHYFYSPIVSGAQRLPNGNTLVTEGVNGRFLEVTPEHEIVWEYISPYQPPKGSLAETLVYRCYRYPYEYAPQAGPQTEVPVEQLDNYTFRVPGAAGPEFDDVEVQVDGARGFDHGGALCVEKDDATLENN